jgi:hypothetical protein
MENEDNRLLKTVENLQNKINILSTENTELKRINKDLNSRINLLLNDNNMIKNVKLEMKDYSDFTQLHNEDTLREFFCLLVLCEKMKYLNNDIIWSIDPNDIFTEAQGIDIPFYEWQNFIKNCLSAKSHQIYELNNKDYCNKTSNAVPTNSSSCGILEKLK